LSAVTNSGEAYGYNSMALYFLYEDMTYIFYIKVANNASAYKAQDAIFLETELIFE